MTEAERISGYLDELDKNLMAAKARIEEIRARGSIRPDWSRIDAVFLGSFLKDATLLNNKLNVHFGRKEKQGARR